MATIGKVRAVYDHGAGDILEIFGPGRKQTLLLPFTRAFVPTVDLAAGRIVADPPDEEDGDAAADAETAAEGFDARPPSAIAKASTARPRDPIQIMLAWAVSAAHRFVPQQ